MNAPNIEVIPHLNRPAVNIAVESGWATMTPDQAIELAIALINCASLVLQRPIEATAFVTHTDGTTRLREHQAELSRRIEADANA